MSDGRPRLLILGAHPDDAEYHAGALASIYRELGRDVKFVSLTNGQAGHFRRPPQQLAPLRRAEAEAAVRVIGAECENWDIPDGELMADLPTRHRVIREIRSYQPDLVLTHRPCDYHPDHRAAGQLVQDASYLVTVPNVLPDTPAIFRDPVVAYMADLFTIPYPLAADVVLDATDRVDDIVAMLACHRSQVFEWLPYEEGVLDQVPDDQQQRMVWLRDWYLRHVGPRAERFRQALTACYGPEQGERIECCEVFEISKYAASPDQKRLQELFPGACCRLSPPR